MQAIRNLPISTLVKEKARLSYVQTDTSIAQVLRVLRENNILSVPVWDNSAKQFVGMLDVLAIARFTTKNWFSSRDESIHSDTPMMESEIFQEAEFEAAKAGDVVMHSNRCKSFSIFEKDSTLVALASALGYGDHRVLVGRDFDSARVLTQSDIIRYLHDHRDRLDPQLLRKPIKELPGLANPMKPVISVKNTDMAIKAFLVMTTEYVNAVAVVDSANKIVDTLSASDLRGLSPQNLKSISRPIAQFLEVFSWQRSKAPGLVSCVPDAALGDVIEKVVKNKVHRVWVVDANGSAVGCMSLTDIIRAIFA